MMRITVILFCLTICLNGLTAEHLVRRSNECQSEDGSDFECPQSDGMFPHKQCTKFWHCSLHYICPDSPTSVPSKPTCKGDQQYYKHSECNKFWQCSNGVAFEMTCAPGTAWDDQYKVCTWRLAVNCQLFHK